MDQKQQQYRAVNKSEIQYSDLNQVICQNNIKFTINYINVYYDIETYNDGPFRQKLPIHEDVMSHISTICIYIPSTQQKIILCMNNLQHTLDSSIYSVMSFEYEYLMCIHFLQFIYDLQANQVVQLIGFNSSSKPKYSDEQEINWKDIGYDLPFIIKRSHV